MLRQLSPGVSTSCWPLRFSKAGRGSVVKGTPFAQVHFPIALSGKNTQKNKVMAVLSLLHIVDKVLGNYMECLLFTSYSLCNICCT